MSASSRSDRGEAAERGCELPDARSCRRSGRGERADGLHQYVAPPSRNQQGIRSRGRCGASASADPARPERGARRTHGAARVSRLPIEAVVRVSTDMLSLFLVQRTTGGRVAFAEMPVGWRRRMLNHFAVIRRYRRQRVAAAVPENRPTYALTMPDGARTAPAQAVQVSPFGFDLWRARECVRGCGRR